MSRSTSTSASPLGRMTPTTTRRIGSCLSLVMMISDAASGFTFIVPMTAPGSNKGTCSSSTTQLQMGLFDGVKEAFSAPAMERSYIDAERETPIDRWMGWSVVREDQAEKTAQQDPNFVDSMDPTNYVAVELEKPMGIVFEENDEGFGGIFVQSLKEGGLAVTNGVLQPGDQLVAVGRDAPAAVYGKSFEDVLDTIVEAPSPTKLTFFRGSEKQLYGPTGASREWLDEFITSGGVEASSSSSSSSAAISS